MRNEKGLFIDQWVNLKLENSSQWSPFSVGQIFKMPMAHADGRFFISEEGYKQLVDKGQIWLTYADNPNGSVGNIAGVMNEAGNVVGMMPHPDRALFSWMGSEDGLEFFQWQDASGVNQ